MFCYQCKLLSFRLPRHPEQTSGLGLLLAVDDNLGGGSVDF